MRVGQVGSWDLFDVAAGQRVRGQDCWPPHWLSTGRRRSSSTCLATSMVSSRSKSPSASNIGSLLPQDRERSHLHSDWLAANHKRTAGSSNTLYTHTNALMCSKVRGNSHRWVYAIGVRVIDRCWGSAVIHIGRVPTCWVCIGCGKPTRTDTHTHTR